MVHEFGDDTPCHDMGDDHARRFQRLLGKNGVRLARKSDEWLAGGVIDPTERHNRPMHIVSQATVREVQSRLPAASFGAERFRPNILLDGDLEAFEENQWIGEQLVIDGVAYVVSKLTARCPVPGYDQHAGQNRADVPKLYQDLPKNDKNKPVFGVYAYPVLERGDSAQIGVGMEVAA